MITGGDGEVGGDRRAAGVSGGTKHRGGPSQRPTKRVLAAAAPDDQYSHFLPASLKAWVNACAAFLAASATWPTTSRASRP